MTTIAGVLMLDSTKDHPLSEHCFAATKIGWRAGSWIVTITFACAWLGLPAMHAEARPLFSAPYLAFDAGPSPIAVSVADVNADGLADLLVANDGSHEVAVLLGQGDALFAAPTTYETAGAGVSVATGDLDRDGTIDLVVANGGASEAPTNSLSVLLGSGDGTFAARKDLATGASPQHVALADLNRDGDLDIVSADNGAHGVSVFLGAGDGHFEAATAFATNVFPSSVAIDDVNEDGILDLAVAHSGIEAVSVLLGNGDGTFRFRTDCWVAGASGSVFLRDVDSDGFLDIVAASGGTISLLLGRGDGTFAIDRTIRSSQPVSYLTVADVNGDGHADFVRAYSLTTSILIGQGDATFVEGESYTCGSLQGDAAVADVDGDGDADLVFPKYGGVVAVLQNRGDGRFNGDRRLEIGLGQSAVAAGDLNADGHTDVVATAGPYAAVFLGSATGQFAPRSLFASGTGGSLALADLNRDGRLDAVSPGAVLLGNGDGSFAAPQVIDFWSGDIAVGYLDRDEHLDFVAANPQVQRVWTRLGRGDGSFDGRLIDYPCANWCKQVALGDLNADGDLDVAVTNLGGSEVTVYLGIGDGRLQSRRDYSTGSSCRSVAIGDLDVDGNLDLVTVNGYRDATLAWLRGLGDGTFAAAEWRKILPSPEFIALEDVNGDEAPDVMVSHSESQSVTLLLNDGNGVLRTVCGFGTGIRPSALLFADIDADGRRDLIVANEGSGSVSLLLQSMPATPVAVEGLQAEVHDVAVRLSWRCSADLVDGRSAIRVLRADAALAEDFVAVSPQLPAQRDMAFDDLATLRGRTYRYRLQLDGPHGHAVVPGEVAASIPAAGPVTALLAPRPRSADGAVEIRYSFAEAVIDMRLAVFDVRGRTIRLLHAGYGEKGEHLVLWDGLDASGVRPSRGLYLVRLVAGAETYGRKLLLW